MKRPSKYGAIRTEVDGITFASKKEARRYSELKLLERAGEIYELEWQVVYPLSVNGTRIGKIIPDFRYRRGDAVVVEDVKSSPTITTIFRWKRKHLLAEHGVSLEVVQ